jgi:uncharacterized protein
MRRRARQYPRRVERWCDAPVREEDGMRGRFPVTARTELRRLPERGRHDRETIETILDESFVCHLGFAVGTQPFVIPMIYGRSADVLYLHGSSGSRLVTALRGGADVCLTVTLIDGLVLARSAFHHSLNYRSAVVFGRATVVSDPATRLEALRVISEHLVPGRWADVRPPSERELRQTIVLAIPLREASAKVRSGPPADDAADLSHPCWAGVVPLGLTTGDPVDDPHLASDTPLPLYLQGFVHANRRR